MVVKRRINRKLKAVNRVLRVVVCKSGNHGAQLRLSLLNWIIAVSECSQRLHRRMI